MPYNAKKIIFRLLKKLAEYIIKLKSFQKYNFKDFEEKAEINWAIDRGLQLIIECSIDIGKEIITKCEFERPEDYKQTFVILSRNKVISSDLSVQMQRLAKFRNELVHDYLYLDLEKIYDVFKNDLKYFEQYLLEVEIFIKKAKKTGEIKK